ncbi:MAG TPA: DUF6794 domain-containing protein [Bacteroidales bacterium]|nr:DUF6794 domain-containing protein [Bacteroidales bacterium]
MRFGILILMLFLSVNLFGQQVNLSREDYRYRPANFDEALQHLNRIICDSIKVEFKTTTESEFLAQTHLGIGMWIRNNWLYNRYLLGFVSTESDLRKSFTEKGIFHNSDISAIILRSFFRQLNDIEINLDQQIKDIRQWHLNMRDPEWRAQQESIALANFMAQYVIGDTLARHIFYDRNWLGNPRKNTVVLAQIVEKSEWQLKINIVCYGGEEDKNLIYQEIDCKKGDCWIYPIFWNRKEDLQYKRNEASQP